RPSCPLCGAPRGAGGPGGGGGGGRPAPFDLVLANILANPLRQLAGPMAQHLAPSAMVVLSGLLPPQAQGVIAAYRARGLVLVRHQIVEGWSSLLLQRR
ncbi:50S ribosomal protein L11 methyltransferase, partial [Rhodopseudomonas sp. BAL398]|uniref:50S ribosomal protein L11 methyltransferase n=1 Tax=Rhodopseudomonas sp. BAL398 TaxID=3034676 RepID=UPI0023E13328